MAGGASAFLRAAELLHENDPASWAWATCFVNIGFAIELGLKAFLRENGMSENGQRALGHDLAETYRTAVIQGFRSSHPAQAALIDQLSPHFSDMSLRYLTGEWVHLPGIPGAIAAAQSLLLDVHEQCGFLRQSA